jgi:hypothetical protein
MNRKDSNRHQDFGELFAVQDLERRLEKQVTGLDKLERVIGFEVFRAVVEEQTDFVGEINRGGRRRGLDSSSSGAAAGSVSGWFWLKKSNHRNRLNAQDRSRGNAAASPPPEKS